MKYYHKIFTRGKNQYTNDPERYSDQIYIVESDSPHIKDVIEWMDRVALSFNNKEGDEERIVAWFDMGDRSTADEYRDEHPDIAREGISTYGWTSESHSTICMGDEKHGRWGHPRGPAYPCYRTPSLFFESTLEGNILYGEII